MRHASAADLVDLAEHAGSPEVARHVESCAACRDQLQALRGMIALNETARDQGADDVPEPSPLFWTHFPGRVQTALESAVARDRTWRHTGFTGRWAVLSLSATLTLGVAAGLGIARWPLDAGLSPGVSMASGDTDAGLPTGSATAVESAGARASLGEDVTATEPDWAVVLQMAEAAQWDDVTPSEMFVADGAADRAVFELSGAERRELKRLLEEEIGASEAESS